MKTYNFATMAHTQAPANEIEQLMVNLDRLTQKHAVRVCVRNLTSAAGIKTTSRATPIAHTRTHNGFAPGGIASY
jgi:hypothetical protein